MLKKKSSGAAKYGAAAPAGQAWKRLARREATIFPKEKNGTAREPCRRHDDCY